MFRKEFTSRILRSIFSLLAIVLCSLLIIFEVSQYKFIKNPNKLLARLMLCIWGGLFYLGQFILSYFSETTSFLQNKSDTVNVKQYIESLQRTAPAIRVNVACFHISTYTSTSRDSQGRTTSSQRSVKNVTYSESREFPYVVWDDCSDALDDNFTWSKPCIKIYMKKSWLFTDEPTLHAFQQLSYNIQAQNRLRDVGMDYSETMDLEKFEEMIIAYSRKPLFFGLLWYALACLLCMGVPYSIYVDLMCVELEFHLRKRVSILPQVQFSPNFQPVSFYQRSSDLQNVREPAVTEQQDGYQILK